MAFFFVQYSQNENLNLRRDIDEIKIELTKTLHDKLNSNLRILFTKIDDTIKKTLYVYNADKTGITDFAAESLGKLYQHHKKENKKQKRSI